MPKMSEMERAFLIMQVITIKKAYYWGFCLFLQATTQILNFCYKNLNAAYFC